MTLRNLIGISAGAYDDEPANEQLQGEEDFARHLVAASQQRGHVVVPPCVPQEQKALEGVTGG